MSIMDHYYDRIVEILNSIRAKEAERIEKASRILADVVQADRLINIFGVGGHSAMAGMEVFYRAGGLAAINPLFPVGMNVIESRPTFARIRGTARYILDYYNLKTDDILVLVNFYGMSIPAVECAMEAVKRGIRLITVNSHAWPDAVPKDFEWRHDSGKSLNDFAEVALDNHVPLHDALLDVDGVDQKVAASGTVATCFLLNALMAQTVEILAERGDDPDIWISYHVPEGDAHNRLMVEKYRSRVPHLYPVP